MKSDKALLKVLYETIGVPTICAMFKVSPIVALECLEELGIPLKGTDKLILMEAKSPKLDDYAADQIINTHTAEELKRIEVQALEKLKEAVAVETGRKFSNGELYVSQD